MSTGDQFLTALKAAIAPRTIKTMVGKPDRMVITLSDKKVIEPKRATIKATAAGAALTAYVAGLIA